MTKPSIAITVPAFAIPDHELEIAIDVTVDKPTEVSSIEIRLIGVDGWHSLKGGCSRFVDREVQVHGPGTLATGSHSFVARFDLPDDAPPTHHSADTFVNLRAIAKISRDWPHADTSEVKLVEIRRLTAPASEPTPGEQSNASTDDRIVVRIASAQLTRRDKIVGTITALAFHHDDPILLDVQLWSIDRTPKPKPGRSVRSVWLSSRVTIPKGHPPVPLELALPLDMVPSFSCATHIREWMLVIKRPGPLVWPQTVALVIEIVDVDTDGLLETTPSVGDRIASRFEAFAAKHGWTRRDGDRDRDHDHDHDSSPSIIRELGNVTLHVAFARDMPGGPSVVTCIDFPSLELGLEVVQSTPLRELFSPDISAADADWDRHFHVTATDEPRASEVVRAVVPVLVAAANLGALVHWTDDEIYFARVTVDPPLEEIAADLERVAAAITATLPPLPHDGVYR